MFFCYLLAGAMAQVYEGFPLDEQLPNVARVGHGYAFQMADQTYKLLTPDTQIVYLLLEKPDWLLFDATSRLFSGTPSTSGDFIINLHGLDPLDQTQMQHQYTFTVSEKPGLSLALLWTNAVSDLGRTTGASSSLLVVLEGQQLLLTFNPEDFVSNGGDSQVVNTYGRLADRSPLPTWLKFDSSSNTFSGTVPEVTSDEAPLYEYLFVYIATDIDGYAAAEGEFKLVVGANLLSTNISSPIAINGSLNADFDTTVPLSSVYLNNQTIQRDNVLDISADNLPDYAKFDSDKMTISGKFPDKEVLDDFTVVVTDKFSNKVTLPYRLFATSSEFTGDFPDANATRGQFWSVAVAPYLTNKLAKVSVKDTEDWMSWHAENNTLNGVVPKNFDHKDVEFDVGSESRKMVIRGVNPVTALLLLLQESSLATSLASVTSEATSEATATADATASSEAVSGENKSSGMLTQTKLAIGLGVGIPCFIIALALIFLLCCLRRRKQRAAAVSDNTSLDMEKHLDIPSPYDDKFPGQLHNRGGLGDINAAVMAAGAAAAAQHQRDVDQSPRQVGPLLAFAFSSPKKAKGVEDMHLTLSSVTRIELDDSYYDAYEKPLKLWRAADWGELDAGEQMLGGIDGGVGVGASGAAAVGAAVGTKRGSNSDVRHSDALMLTVNTDQLFSVRLVDQDPRELTPLLLPTLLVNQLILRELLGNVQILNDTEDLLKRNDSTASGYNRHSLNLDVLHEEAARGAGVHEPRELDSLVYYTGDLEHQLLSSLSPDLLEKANRKSLIRTDDVLGHVNDEDEDHEDFRATATLAGFTWEQAPHGSFSPNTDGFTFSDSPQTLKNSLRNSTLSQLSIHTGNLQELLLNKSQELLTKTQLPLKAKLVNFTRKGLLREQQTFVTQGHTELLALIRGPDDSDLERSSRALSNYD